MKVYVGSRDDRGTHVRVEERKSNGAVVRAEPLRHLVRHSPTGFEWGYAGSGPADLSRSILYDALGDRAICRTCEGGGKLVFDEALSDFRPPRGPGDLREANERAARYGDADHVVTCFELDCDHGRGPVPYMAFKFEVVALLTRSEGWEISEESVLEWFESRSAAVG